MIIDIDKIVKKVLFYNRLCYKNIMIDVVEIVKKIRIIVNIDEIIKEIFIIIDIDVIATKKVYIIMKIKILDYTLNKR